MSPSCISSGPRRNYDLLWSIRKWGCLFPAVRDPDLKKKLFGKSKSQIWELEPGFWSRASWKVYEKTTNLILGQNRVFAWLFWSFRSFENSKENYKIIVKSIILEVIWSSSWLYFSPDFGLLADFDEKSWKSTHLLSKTNITECLGVLEPR